VRMQDLAAAVPGSALKGDGRIRIGGLSIHSSRTAPGDLFVALPGTRADGADYLHEAVEHGAAAVAAREFAVGLPPAVCQLRTPDTVRALPLLAEEFFGHPSRRLRLAGITGTNGKTTVAFLLRYLLERGGVPAGLLGTVRYQIGERNLPSELTTPAPPLLQELLASMVKAALPAAVMEVSSHALSQHRLDGLVFETAVFTNLTPEHLDYHRDMEEYGRAKIRLFSEHLSPRGTAVLSRSDPLSGRIRDVFPGRVLTFGPEEDADFRARDIVLEASSSRFTLAWPGGEERLRIPLVGRFNVLNALAAAAAASAFGVSPERAAGILQSAPGVPGRLETVAEKPFRVIVDYAHSPDALGNVLAALRETSPGSRVILVFGCGGDRDRSKRPRMGAIAAAGADLSIVTSDNPRSENPEAIIAEIAAGFGSAGARAEIEPDRRRAIRTALAAARPGDTVLVAGKGHEERQIFADRVVPFSDRLEVLGALEERQ